MAALNYIAISEQSFQKLKRWKELGHSEETNGD